APGRFEANNGIINLSGQRRCFALSQIIRRLNEGAVLIDEHDLVAILLDRRSLIGPSKAVADRYRGLDLPGIACVDVVSLDRALLDSARSNRQQVQISSAARVHQLSQTDQTEG